MAAEYQARSASDGNCFSAASALSPDPVCCEARSPATADSGHIPRYRLPTSSGYRLSISTSAVPHAKPGFPYLGGGVRGLAACLVPRFLGYRLPTGNIDYRHPPVDAADDGGSQG